MTPLPEIHVSPKTIPVLESLGVNCADVLAMPCGPRFRPSDRTPSGSAAPRFNRYRNGDFA